MKNKFKDYHIRIWNDDNVSIDSSDLDFCTHNNLIGVQTNSLDESINSEIEEVCKRIHKDFIELNKKLNEIREK